MKILHRIIVAIAATLLTFIFSNISNNVTLFSSLTVTIVTLLVSSFVLFLDKIFENLDGEYLLTISLGVFVGLLSGNFAEMGLKSMGIASPEMIPSLYIIPMVFFGYVGAMFSRFPGLKIFGGGGGFGQDKEGSHRSEKILDTSVIIDGRILDIAETNFLEGPFIIPNFVLREIQLISDSPDPVKRNRGRRGLEMLNKLQQHGSVKVKISYADYADIREVDAKLVKLARETGARLITNDFNLNKVAELQGVLVLNLNNLTNALKPVVLPGEEILIDVIKEGKDENQGIGYLEDGTMVVVENGRSLLNKTVRVNVTSIIQTAAGKMIFTRAAGVVEETEEDIPMHNLGREEPNGGGNRDNRGGGRDNRSGNRGGRSQRDQGGRRRR